MSSAYIFDAKLEGFPEVTRKVTARDDQQLTDLHDALQGAFDWADDHLYGFWLTGRFWEDRPMYTTPSEIEPEDESAEVALADLDLAVG